MFFGHGAMQRQREVDQTLPRYLKYDCREGECSGAV
jgi:hypothetical protein